MDPLEFVRKLVDEVTLGISPDGQNEQRPTLQPKWLEPVPGLPPGTEVVLRSCNDSLHGTVLEAFLAGDGRPVAIISGLGLILQGEEGRWRKPHSTKLWSMLVSRSH